MVAERVGRRYIPVMAKQNSKSRSSTNGTYVTVTGGRSKTVTTKLGDVTVRGARPTPDMVEASVDRSSLALERVSKRLIKPGVDLRAKKGVPRYAADENNPGVFIRRLDGRITTGRLQNGKFVETK